MQNLNLAWKFNFCGKISWIVIEKLVKSSWDKITWGKLVCIFDELNWKLLELRVAKIWMLLIESCKNWKFTRLKVYKVESSQSWKWVQHFFLSCQIAKLQLQVAKLWTCDHGAKSPFRSCLGLYWASSCTCVLLVDDLYIPTHKYLNFSIFNFSSSRLLCVCLFWNFKL